MMSEVYFDTSALAKWYLNEAHSEEVETFLLEHGPVAISDLTRVEMRSLLARHRREKQIDARMESKVFATFSEDIRRKHLTCHPLPEGLAAGAVNLLALLSEQPLRTLDALHLVIAQEIGAERLATSDRVMAASGRALGMTVIKF
jgi:predicted nucleic acid-binding protein